MRRSVFRKVLLSAPVFLLYVLASFLAGCSSSNNNHSTTGTPAAISASAGGTQTATTGTAFATALAATVTDSSGNPVSGASVSFTAPSSGASGTFANGTATETDTTNSSGVATASTFTANSTAGSYTVTATVSGVSTPASFSLTNNSSAPTTTTYIFSLSGTELANSNNGGIVNYYALAGAVTIDTNGNVTAGEEDYNDGFGITQSAVPITSGSLTVDGTGQGTLTIVTGNDVLGGGINPVTGNANPAGTEVLGVQFANVNHAMIMQFDGTATSSGSLDLQTTPPGNTANYAFVLSGVDYNYAPVAYGGVLTVNSNAMTGIADANYYNYTSNAFAVATQNLITGASVGTGDSFGRGQINGLSINGTTLALTYYVVGPETVRLIDMDAGGNAGAGAAMIGSAYGQGSATFSNASLGNADVLGLQGGAWAENRYAVAGSILPVATSGTNGGTFSGIVDDFEVNASSSSPDTDVSGTYTMSNVVSGNTYNGYGTLTLPVNTLYKVSNLGVYMTDPALNLVDPNNTTSGLGGALVLDLDTFLTGGTGVLVSQTDTTPTDFSGNYALGAQESFSQGGFFWEYDYLGQTAVSSLALTGTAEVSDPFDYFQPAGALYTGVAVSGTATPDGAEATNGRYTMCSAAVTTCTPVSPFVLDVPPTDSLDNLSLAIYQADGTLLFFMENSGSDGLGYFEQQGSLTGLPAKRSPVNKAKRTLKPRSKSFSKRHKQ